MTIPDEAIEAAARAAYGELYQRYMGMMRKALAAALPLLMPGWREERERLHELLTEVRVEIVKIHAAVGTNPLRDLALAKIDAALRQEQGK